MPELPENASWRGRLNLRAILVAAGIKNLDEVLVIRHTFKEAGLLSPADATPEKVLAYTREQVIGAGKFPKEPPRWWLVFIADGRRRSRLFGAYENLGEAEAERTETLRFYDLVESDLLDALDGRLVIEWSADGINWAKRGAVAADFPVVEISDPGAVPFPGFDRVTLPFAQLREVVSDSRYAAWRTALGAVQGIYLIADSQTGRLYVGKADGSERILGRWRYYAETGHGGNVLLKDLLDTDPSRVEHFTWSLLRVFGSNTTQDVVDEAESHFKDTLLTKRFGYNAN
ncbi:GIY-YIG nuclease family protein [Demequina sp. SYSU T00068]|uniref:GIY-YIG nuclease family protein n=1 Tax=Demequina lignilytica TaxID=3051663 RepID=UPI002614F83D|nr:GIY-YIG nuclease family protein [Demequina sp. SYSU T00068]MDN4491050.1 GIY-YIG nuclease family protein [Demequina sp. SYSU T00068]